MHDIDQMTSRLKSKLLSEINDAKSVDELKQVMVKIVETKPVLKSENVKGWVDIINRNRSLIAQANASVGYDEPSDYTYADCDDLIQVKYIGSTKKEWKCCDCKKTIPIGSEAFRSFKKSNFNRYEKLYRCVSCMSKVVESIEKEGNEAIHAIAFHEANL